MKATDFAGLVQRYAESGVAPRVLDDLRRLSSAFAAAGSRTVASVLKAAAGTSPSQPSPGGDAEASLRQLRALIAPIAKAGVAKDIDAVADAIRRRGLAALIAAVQAPARRASGSRATLDQQAVDRAVADLTAALGKTDAFAAAFQRIVDAASTKEIVAIARAFSPGAVKSAAEAKRRILSRQQALTGVAAKSRATSGRSAA
jgi:hypothetical protein